MTEGSPYRLILEFAFPVFLSQLFQQFYNTADTLIVGKFLGMEALAAVGSSGTLIHLLSSFFIGTAMGAGVVISRYFGAKEYEKVSKAIHTTVLLGVLCGVLLTVVGVIFTPTFLVWMHTDPDVLPKAVEYFRFYFMGSAAVVIYNNCNSILNALGDSKRPLYYLIISSLMNIVLDVLFIGVFGWGVWSAAMATTISQAVSMVLCLRQLCKKGNFYQLQLKKMRLEKDMVKEILHYGLPSGVQNSVIGLANVIVQTNINSFGKLATAAYGSYVKIEGFAFLPVTSFNMALTTFIGQNLGAKQYDRAKTGSRFGVLSAVVLAELIGIGMFLFAEPLVHMFSDDPGVVELGVRQMHIEALFFCLLAFSHAIGAVCRGAGKAVVPMVIMLAVWCVFRISYITVAMKVVHELAYIYWAYPLTWGISSVIFGIYYHCSDWLHGFEQA